MSQPLVSINLVVWNREHEVRACLEAVRQQTYPYCEVVIFDNHSTDSTKDIIKKEFPEYTLIENDKNEGGPEKGWNRCLPLTHGAYFLGLCVDVVLDKTFVAEAVRAMETMPAVGALQAKIYQMTNERKTDIIDTTGFLIFRSRKIINRGHGEKDTGQFPEGEIFSYEGAAPFWRRKALEESAVYGEVHDEDFVWYALDIDLGWRMRLLGWKSYFLPSLIAYHDRQTTKRLSKSWWDFIRLRRTIPRRKRMLDWRNTRFTFLKNDFFISALKDFPFFVGREFCLFCYIIMFEPFLLQALPRMLFLLPRMLRKRRWVMQHARVSRQEMEQWFQR